MKTHKVKIHKNTYTDWYKQKIQEGSYSEYKNGDIINKKEQGDFYIVTVIFY